jgi:hypothetical protein
MNDAHLFKIARKCSLHSDYESNCSSARVGCIVTYKGAILAKSYNSNKTHTEQAKFNKWRYNEDAAKKLAESIETYFKGKRMIFIMGVLKDKEYEKVLSLTAKYAEHILTITPPENPRALGALELAKAAGEYHSQVTNLSSLEEAVEVSHLLADKDTVILCFGSLSYLGAVKKIYERRKEQRW